MFFYLRQVTTRPTAVVRGAIGADGNIYWGCLNIGRFLGYILPYDFANLKKTGRLDEFTDMEITPRFNSLVIKHDKLINLLEEYPNVHETPLYEAITGQILFCHVVNHLGLVDVPEARLSEFQFTDDFVRFPEWLTELKIKVMREYYGEPEPEYSSESPCYIASPEHQ